jgi:hypothetical protein
MHGEDHLAQDLVARKPSKLNRLVTDLHSLEIPCSKIVPVTDSVPQWNEKPDSAFQKFSHTSVMLFAVTRARIVLTLHVSLAKMLSPLPKSKCFV